MNELDSREAHLGRIVQAALGQKLRAQYDGTCQNLPVAFVHLLRRLASERSAGTSAALSDPTPAQAIPPGAFDPETIGKLERALEDGWGALCHIGIQTITQERLASRIFALAEAGERDSARLATQAVTSLIMEGESL
jgi:hypothetical protein